MLERESGNYVKVFNDEDTEAEKFKRLRQCRSTLDFLIQTVGKEMASQGHVFDSIMSMLEENPEEGLSPSALKTRIRMRTSLELASDDEIELTLGQMQYCGLINLVHFERRGSRGASPKRYMVA